MSMIEIRIHNYDDGQHPLHTHGHHVQLVYRKGKLFGPEANDDVLVPGISKQAHSSDVVYPAVPMRRDTWTIAPNGETRIRFIADNPGMWLLHCHMDWHVEAGLTIVMVEAPEKIQEQKQTITQMTDLCRDQGVPTEGNAVGNSKNWLDLSGEVTTPPINNG